MPKAIHCGFFSFFFFFFASYYLLGWQKKSRVRRYTDTHTHALAFAQYPLPPPPSDCLFVGGSVWNSCGKVQSIAHISERVCMLQIVMLICYASNPMCVWRSGPSPWEKTSWMIALETIHYERTWNTPPSKKKKRTSIVYIYLLCNKKVCEPSEALFFFLSRVAHAFSWITDLFLKTIF